MNRSVTQTLLIAAAVVLLNSAATHADVVVFGVDYGFTGQDIFTDHEAATGPNINGAVPHVTTNGTVTATLSGTDSSGLAQFQYRAPGQTSRNDVTGTSVNDLVEDLVAARDSATQAVTGNMSLTLAGLAAGSYQFRSYHNENIDVGNGFATGQTITAFIGATNMGSVVPLNLSAPPANNDTQLRYIEFAILSNGIDPIVINYTAKSGAADAFMFLNGFTITIPTPAALPAGLGLVGLWAMRRHRRRIA